MENKKVSTEDMMACGGICLLLSGLIGAVLNCVILPIAYIIFHDCGRWICSHSYPMTWGNYLLCCLFSLVVILIIVAIASCGEKKRESGYQSSVNHKTYTSFDDLDESAYGSPRRHSTRSSARVTDYYDSDVEGAPGYYGGW